MLTFLLYFLVPILVIVLIIVLFKYPTEEETPESSLHKLEQRRSDPTKTPDSSLDEYRREKNPKEYHKPS